MKSTLKPLSIFMIMIVETFVLSERV